MTDEPFGRQPQPVRVTLQGEQLDIDHFMQKLRMIAESDGSNTVRERNIFTIYPRAVND